MVLAHFKNDTIKGTQHLPLSKFFKGPFIYLEQAHDYLASQCPTLWFNTHFQTYQKAYWSTICSKALTLPDGRRITAKDFRHMFATAWRDYINCPTTKLLDTSLHELDAAAADLMCSSTQAFTNAYDHTNRVRGTQTVLSHWLSFKSYVESQQKLKESERWGGMSCMICGLAVVWMACCASRACSDVGLCMSHVATPNPHNLAHPTTMCCADPGTQGP